MTSRDGKPPICHTALHLSHHILGVLDKDASREFAISKQMNLIFADMIWTEAVRQTAEVLRKIFHRIEGASI